MWHNFFAAKASYLKTRPEPLLEVNRFYYEGWLAGQPIYEKNYEQPSKNKGISMLSKKGISMGDIIRDKDCNQLLLEYKLTAKQ